MNALSKEGKYEITPSMKANMTDFYGNYATYAEAQKSLRTVKAKLSTAYVVAYVNGKAVSVAEARAKEQEKKW